MKIKKITETEIINGNIQVNDIFHIIFEDKDTGIQLDLVEMINLHELVISNLNYPNRSVPYEPETVLGAVNKYEELGDAAECPDYIEPLEEIIESKENLTSSEDKTKDKAQEVKKPTNMKKSKRDYSKYIKMYESGVDSQKIKKTIQDDLVILNITAEQYFYSKVKSKAKQEPEIGTKNEKDPALFESIDSMPHYHSYQQFKDACAAADIGRGRYSIIDLKEIYLETHSTVRW